MGRFFSSMIPEKSMSLKALFGLLKRRKTACSSSLTLKVGCGRIGLSPCLGSPGQLMMNTMPTRINAWRVREDMTFKNGDRSNLRSFFTYKKDKKVFYFS